MRFKRSLIVPSLVAMVIVALVSWQLYLLRPGPIFYFSTVWAIIILLLLWLGNRLLTRIFDSVISWRRWGNVRFFIQLILSMIYLLALINVTYFTIKVMLTDAPPSSEQLVVMNGWGALIFIPIFSIYFSMFFLRHWRTSELAAESLQKENIRAQLDSLKNHLDPHFLFNNLNILSSLVETDHVASKKFIQKFADVYRSILRTKSDDLIYVREEFEFIESYIYLIKTRFGENILFNVNLSDGARTRMIPPLTLQLLLENAIKHNIITESMPLSISFSSPDSNSLCIRNSLNRKPKNPGEPTGSGIANIRKRYSHFTSQTVTVTETSDHFEVNIPLLEIVHA